MPSAVAMGLLAAAACAPTVLAPEGAPHAAALTLAGDFSSDVPAPLLDGGAACTADYAPGGRNPGLVRVTREGVFSFYEDREGRHAIAEDCRFAARGTRRDPRWFGSASGQSMSSIWSLYELVSGAPACEARFYFVIVRAPEGEGRLRHMHLRYGPRGTSLDRLVALSAADAGAEATCDPWWSVYCSRGVTGCDPD